MPSYNCCFLTCIQISQWQVKWSGIPISLRIFQSLTNRFNGLDLIECLKNNGQRFVTLYRDQDHSQEKEMQKAKWLSEEALQIAEKRREAKGKGERERYTHLNSEFQRIARRDKKAFLSDQYKVIEEINRMEKTSNLFKKIRDTKRIFHAKMGSIKDRNGMDLAEAEDIKNRWQEYTEELYGKDLHDPDDHDGVIIHLEPDILECEVKWALGSITTKLVEVMEFQLSYFKS